MFDLETAIATWRRAYEVNPAFSDDDLEELEGSLRDRIDVLSKRMSEQEAFEVAVRRIGSLGKAEVEYKKVYWGKLKRERRITDELIWRGTMLKNYVIIALRTLRKQRGYTFINISGLAIGLTCFMLMALFVQFELSYDTFHEKADRIYRIIKEDPGNYYLGTNRFAVTPAPLASTLMEEFPEVEYATQINQTEILFEHQGSSFYEEGIYATDYFFDVFSFPLLQGDPHTALTEPNSLILTESFARKYFGDADLVGQSISVTPMIWWNPLNETSDMKVTGIVEDVPANSHFRFDYIISMSSSAGYNRDFDTWNSNNYLTYGSLYPDQSLPAFADKLQQLAHEKLSQYEHYQRNPERISTYFPQALTGIHLRSQINSEFGVNGNIKYVYLFSTIAILILLIACINYINLATARSITRNKEVGVRKVMGARRGQLIAQFMGEAIIPTILALLVAGALVLLLMPTFNTLTARDIALAGNRGFVLALLLIGLVMGIFSGSYPALLMSSFNPVGMMKGVQRFGKTTLSNVLVVVQFTATIALIISTLVIWQQLGYLQGTNTGIDRDQIVSIRNRDPNLIEKYTTLKQSLVNHPQVLGVTALGHDPVRITMHAGTRQWEGSEDGQSAQFYHTPVHDDIVGILGIELVEGQGFSETITSEESVEMLINETLKEQLGWDTAVGKWMNFQGREHRIVGVMKDFNFLSLHQEMAPLALYYRIVRRSEEQRIMVKVGPEDMQDTIAFLEKTMSEFSPVYPFEYEFLDDAYNNMYQSEIRLGNLLSYFAIIALFIACLGLLGLATFTAQQRTKEIGVRKVLGASQSDILVLLSKDLTRLVAIAFLIAAPIGYFALSRWLEDYAYRVSIRWGPFVIAGGAVLLIALLTVSYQSIRAALANPVKSLRHE